MKDLPFFEKKKKLQRLLGMINYSAKFVPNLSENTENLRKLLVVPWVGTILRRNGNIYY